MRKTTNLRPMVRPEITAINKDEVISSAQKKAGLSEFPQAYHLSRGNLSDADRPARLKDFFSKAGQSVLFQASHLSHGSLNDTDRPARLLAIIRLIRGEIAL